jgi:hypothetical protein
VTFVFALSIGFVMQYGDALAARFLPGDAEPELTHQQAETLAVLGENSASITALPDDATIVAIIGDVEVAAPAAPIEQPVLLAAVDDAEIDVPVFDAPIQSAAPNCDVTMTAIAQPHAMVEITVGTPCFANESLVIHHQGMMFTAHTSEDGMFNGLVPALAEDAFFIAAFDNGEGAIAQVMVPDLANYDRSVLQWQGAQDIHMHAREFGAGYGEDGHISNEFRVAGDMDLMEQGAGGYMHALGDAGGSNPLMAEVYTFPSGAAAADGAVLLTAEIEVTAANCGREIIAQSLQISPDADAIANDLVMMIPDCDAIGEFLVLNNMFRDLTIASR